MPHVLLPVIIGALAGAIVSVGIVAVALAVATVIDLGCRALRIAGVGAIVGAIIGVIVAIVA